MASTPSFTACRMRCACTSPSSFGGVSHSTSTFVPLFSESSLAAASAPVRDARNTGLSELFAIMAIRIDLPPAPAAPPALAESPVAADLLSPPLQASAATHSADSTTPLQLARLALMSFSRWCGYFAARADSAACVKRRAVMRVLH